MKKRILIIGDSWGIGAYRPADHFMEMEPIPDTGLDFYLRKYGYDVKVVAEPGGDNLSLFDRIEDADHIIWMHTETNRDLISKKIEGNNFTKLTAIAAENNYKLAQSIKIPFIVIGCLSPLHESINKYSFYSHRIDSWLHNLTRYNVALNVHADYMQKVIDLYSPVDKDFLITEIDKMLEIEKALETHPAFSYGVHPNANSFRILADRCHNMITGVIDYNENNFFRK
jgi:hypothetical protein